LFITAINKENSILAFLIQRLKEQNKKKETIPPVINQTSNLDKISIFTKLNKLYQKPPVKQSQPPLIPIQVQSQPPPPPVKPIYNFSYLPFDPSKISAGDAKTASEKYRTYSKNSA